MRRRQYDIKKEKKNFGLLLTKRFTVGNSAFLEYSSQKPRRKNDLSLFKQPSQPSYIPSAENNTNMENPKHPVPPTSKTEKRMEEPCCV